MLARTLSLLSFLLWAISAGASARTIESVETISRTGYDEFRFVGWNDACSAAISYTSYPPIGENVLQGVPDKWLIATVTIPPQETQPKEDQLYASGQGFLWQKSTAAETIARMERKEYPRKGYVEDIRDAPILHRPDLELILRTTSSFKLEGKVAWPIPRYRLSRIHYSPLADCALFVFRNKSSHRDSYRYAMARILEPGVRHLRAHTHVINGLLLYDAADIYGGVDELGTAAGMDPGYASARYHYAVLLATHGRHDEALAELKAAFHLDPSYKNKARDAIEFDTLRRRDNRFKRLLKS